MFIFAFDSKYRLAGVKLWNIKVMKLAELTR